MKKRKRYKRINDMPEKWNEKELNIRYHDVNPQWNYTISPRLSSAKKVKAKKK